MRLRFQTTPVDLYAVLLYVGLVSAALAATGAGNVLGLVLVFLAPGYLATAAILPRDDDGDWTLRLGLTLGLSLALVAFLGIALNYSPWGVTFASGLVSIVALSAFLGGGAYLRRMRVPRGERLEVSVDLGWTRWGDYTRGEQVLAVALVLVLLASAPLVGFALSQPRPAQGFTELYLLGPQGNFTGYPTELNASQPGSLEVVVANHEGGTRNYSLRVDLVAVQIVYNATTKQNETIELNRSTLQTFPLNLADQGLWTQPFTFSIASPGTWEVQFLLTESGSGANPYREVSLLVTIR